mmetsp:Transcript_38966/g.54343  ORF Transcript_38966/g.54343 Transcript_38966/m.54343 type:complete len:234 (-) Transcript_38966:259-960(-)
MALLNWLYTFSLFLYSIGSISFPYYFGFDPLLNSFRHLIGVIIFVSLDLIVSDSAWYNRKVLHLNGYTDFHLCFFLFSSTVITFFAFYPLGLYTQKLNFHFDFPFIFWVFFNMSLGEIFFTLAHKQLYLHFPSLHHAHHCCLRSSFSSNIIFHPIDLMLEFSLPGLVPLFNYFYLFPSNWVLIFTVFCQTTWYSMVHDESLQLPHYFHHKYMTKDRSQNDLVRKMVKRPRSEK